MLNLAGKVVAITGAANGIGRALALAFAQQGSRLALSDIDAEGLSATSDILKKHDNIPLTTILDVADRKAVFAWADEVNQHFGQINLICNNAGVTLNVDVAEMDIEDFRWLMDVNFWGVVHGSQAFLPHLLTSGEGHIVNISSIFGELAVPSQSAYNSAKFAVRGFTDALNIEMRNAGHPVGVSCVLPGGISTHLVRRGRTRGSGDVEARHTKMTNDFEGKIARNSPDYCAKKIVRGVQKNASRILVGADAQLIDLLVRLLPQTSIKILARLTRSSTSEATFTIS